MNQTFLKLLSLKLPQLRVHLFKSKKYDEILDTTKSGRVLSGSDLEFTLKARVLVINYSILETLYIFAV